MSRKDARERRIEKLEAILDVAKAMSKQRDITSLLELIVHHAAEVAHAERGTIFLFDKEKNELWSKVAHGSAEIRFSAHKGIAGHVVKTKSPLNILNAYTDPRFNPEVDKNSGFRTRNILAIPMMSTKEEVVGVLEVLNKIPRLPPPKKSGSNVPAFDQEDEELLMAFGGQAASAIENALLYESINKLFEGFIKASVVAIEARDPTTSGHSERVAVLTCGLAETVDRTNMGPFGKVKFDYDQMKAIRYASLLHDFGKVGVREQVLVKAEKLFPSELSQLQGRFDFIKRTIEKEALENKLKAYNVADAGKRNALLGAIDEDLRKRLAEIDGICAFIMACNVPTVLEKGGFERLNEIATRTYEAYDGIKPFLTKVELSSLSVRKGSLTEEDRLEIESHVTHTYRFLSTIPWTPELQLVPIIAYGHHEKLDGGGYPRKLPALDIPVQTRMMTISDIYDALTARDRPYKKSLPVEKALDILQYEAKAGKVDSALLSLFIEARVFDRIKSS